ncbi:hypothetical protein [Saccharibacillus alkalitolerans]|uniref:Uncharacterized protein n=1 Tax=Saccharibacillus alkalitolerans TaxID=2705290 RepID=A0ABX0FCF8_9BACL|nr:hypothetical protein [Saccharibacillus alkalitolerans]NGZ75777.1 hypothetical protein [Saccharibacillus alkalitolerans]
MAFWKKKNVVSQPEAQSAANASQPGEDCEAIARAAYEIVSARKYAETGERIDSGGLKKLRRNLQIPEHAWPIAFCDATFIGRYAHGAAFTNLGIHWKYELDHYFISWEEFKRMPAPVKGKGPWEIRLGDYSLTWNSRKFKDRDILEILRDIHATNQLAPEPGTDAVFAKGPIPLAQRELLQEAELVPDEAFLLALCRSAGYFNDAQFWDAERVPKQKPERETFGVPQSEKVLAFRDEGLRSKGHVGAVLTDKGFYFRNSYPVENGEKEIFLSYGRLADSEQVSGTSKGVKTGEIGLLNTIHVSEAEEMLENLRLYLASLKAPGSEACREFPYASSYLEPWDTFVAPGGGERWMVAEDGMPRGIYKSAQIQAAAAAGKVDTYLTRFWTFGAERWMTAAEAGFASAEP